MIEEFLYMFAKNPVLLIVLIVLIAYFVKKSGMQKTNLGQGNRTAIESGSLAAAFERAKNISFWDFYNKSVWR